MTPARPRLARAEVLPPDGQAALAMPGSPITAAEREALAAMVAGGLTPTTAYRLIRPHACDQTCYTEGKRLADSMAGQIASLRQAAARAAAVAHGVNIAYLIGETKKIYETPLSALGPDHHLCKKYKLTETMTDAGPKTTLEVEKDAPLACLALMGKWIGADQGVASLPSQGDGSQAGAEEAVRQAFARVLGRTITAGSPIARAVQAAREVGSDTKMP